MKNTIKSSLYIPEND